MRERAGQLVGLAVVLGALELHLEALHADLEAVHGRDGCLSRHGRVVAHEPCTHTSILIIVASFPHVAVYQQRIKGMDH